VLWAREQRNDKCQYVDQRIDYNVYEMNIAEALFHIRSMLREQLHYRTNSHIAAIKKAVAVILTPSGEDVTGHCIN
jgi:hypothetical protein